MDCHSPKGLRNDDKNDRIQILCKHKKSVKKSSIFRQI
ncbi:hypothetical protein HFN_0546 [Helicobacter fennelliae MRY12-0050]|uniref:Uncharacterized protein n=1 Tax=Helicobacter fennelliae MRY12-0050 TaxID=1325130 RepID=T1CZT4_9HELI|nr:hypothetical protein HFN_0546 [Helicobacter fennelliae MRY12-0050]